MKYIAKLLVLLVMCASLVLLLDDRTVNASANDDFGCYGNLQVCENNCAANPDPQTCNTTCFNNYDTCIMQLPVDNFNTCIQQCPDCLFGAEDMNYCSTAFVKCKQRCLSGGGQ